MVIANIKHLVNIVIVIITTLMIILFIALANGAIRSSNTTISRYKLHFAIFKLGKKTWDRFLDSHVNHPQVESAIVLLDTRI